MKFIWNKKNRNRENINKDVNSIVYSDGVGYMVKYKISVDHDKCIGCGACEGNCDNFSLMDGKSSPVNSEVDALGCDRGAADGCPVGAISVEGMYSRRRN